MDWVGVGLAERLMQVILLLAALLSMAFAYNKNYFPFATYGMIVGFAITAVLIVPNWPCFNMYPQKWHTPIDIEQEKQYYQNKENEKGKENRQKKNKNQKKFKKDKKSRDDSNSGGDEDVTAQNQAKASNQKQKHRKKNKKKHKN